MTNQTTKPQVTAIAKNREMVPQKLGACDPRVRMLDGRGECV